MFLRNVSTKKLIFHFHCYFVVCSGKFKPFGKIFLKKGHQNDECLSMYAINTIPHVKCFVGYLPTRCICIRNPTRSLRSLVRFLILKQLVCKYRKPALSMKYSLYMSHRRYLKCRPQNSARYNRIIQRVENTSFLETLSCKLHAFAKGYKGYKSNFGFHVPFTNKIRQI